MEINKIKTITGAVATDDRGSVRFVNEFDFANVKRFYQVQNHKQGFIRAWHAHEREAKYVYAAAGSALIGAVPLSHMLEIKNGAQPDFESKIFKTIISANKPQIVYIPPGYANGFKSLEKNTILQFFSTSSLDDSLGDDIRFDYDTVNIWEDLYR